MWRQFSRIYKAYHHNQLLEISYNKHEINIPLLHTYVLSFRRRSKKTSKLRVTGLCAENSLVTGEFPAEMASNTENVSIWWRHHKCTPNRKLIVRCGPVTISCGFKVEFCVEKLLYGVFAWSDYSVDKCNTRTVNEIDMTPLQVSCWRGKFLLQTHSGTPSTIYTMEQSALRTWVACSYWIIMDINIPVIVVIIMMK